MWQVCKAKYERGHVLSDLQRQVIIETWFPVPGFPPTETSMESIRQYVSRMEPERKDHPDELIRKVWPSYRRNFGIKLIRIPC